MPEILAILEVKDSATLRPASLHVISFAENLARQLGASFSIVMLGHRIQQAVESARAFGAKDVYAVDDELFEDPIAERCVPTLRGIVEQLDARYVLGAATSTGKDLLPRLAETLGAAYVSDCVGTELNSGRVIWKRPVCAGNAIAYCDSVTSRTVVTVRHSQFEAAKPNGRVSPIRRIEPQPADPASASIEFLGYEAVDNPRPELSEAKVVVSGGRALAGRFFEVLNPLADILGAALGATRAACDAGYAPGDFQVGQTGKVVSPELYLAVGISGAVQHLAGMKGSKVIVAINSDPKAPMVSMADYAIIGDLFKLVPELVGELRRRPGSS
jgi:electron transfer flavoprotein alpha subunit